MRNADPNQQSNNSQRCSAQARMQIGLPGGEQTTGRAKPPSGGLKVRSRRNHGRPHATGTNTWSGANAAAVHRRHNERRSQRSRYILPGPSTRSFRVHHVSTARCRMAQDGAGASCLGLRRLSTRLIGRRVHPLAHGGRAQEASPRDRPGRTRDGVVRRRRVGGLYTG